MTTTQPTAYGPVPGPPINPDLGAFPMTTQTQAELGTPLRCSDAGEGNPLNGIGLLWIVDASGKTIASMCPATKAIEIVHRCNLHDELAAFAQDAAKWFVMRPGGTGNLEARAATLLSRCQESQP